MSSVPIITIDGPVGSGKGTIARNLSQRLGWHLLDSGALYRLLALWAFRNQLPLEGFGAEGPLAALAKELPCEFHSNEEGFLDVFLAGELVTTEIRSESIGNSASKVASLGAVRANLLERQRAFAQMPGLVADGRDMGTVVFPQAGLKIFLEASVEVRAHRRFLDLQAQGLNVSLQSLCLEISERDLRDKTRSLAPLRAAEDAILIDSTSLSISEVLSQILALLAERMPLVFDEIK